MSTVSSVDVELSGKIQLYVYVGDPPVGTAVNCDPLSKQADPLLFIDTDKSGLMVTASVVEEHPLEASVNVNVTVPGPVLLTLPVLETIATSSSLLDHEPPEVGDNVVSSPSHNSVSPVISTVGLPFGAMTIEPIPSHPSLLVTVTWYVPSEKTSLD